MLRNDYAHFLVYPPSSRITSVADVSRWLLDKREAFALHRMRRMP